MTESEETTEYGINNNNGVDSSDFEAATTSQHINPELNEKDERSKQLSLKLQKAAAELVKSSNALPKLGDGYELYASYPDYASFMKQQQIRVIASMRKLAAYIGCKAKISSSELEDMEKIIIANDLLIERVGISFDEHQQQITKELLKTRKIASKAEQIQAQPSSTIDKSGPTAPFKRPRLSSEVVAVPLNNNNPTNPTKNALESNDKNVEHLPHKKSGKINGTQSSIAQVSTQQNSISQCSVQKKALVHIRQECVEGSQISIQDTQITSATYLARQNSVEQSSEKIIVYVKDERNPEESCRVKEKVIEIYTRINKWATPFECYTVAIMKRQESQPSASVC